MTIERDDRGGCLVLVVHGEVDLSTGGRLMEAGIAALHVSALEPVVLGAGPWPGGRQAGAAAKVARSHPFRTRASPRV